MLPDVAAAKLRIAIVGMFVQCVLHGRRVGSSL